MRMASNTKRDTSTSDAEVKTSNQEETKSSTQDPATTTQDPANGGDDGDGEFIDSHHSACRSASNQEDSEKVAKLPAGSELMNAKRSHQEIIETLQKYDIICGRSKLSHHNNGNQWFRSLIYKYKEPYQRAPSRNEKTNITKWILNKIKSEGGRFLIGDGEKKAFKEAGDEYCKEKISHALRSRQQSKDPPPVLLPPPKKERKRKPPPPPKPRVVETTVSTLFQRQQQLMQTMLHSDAEMIPSPQLEEQDQRDFTDQGNHINKNEWQGR